MNNANRVTGHKTRIDFHDKQNFGRPSDNIHTVVMPLELKHECLRYNGKMEICSRGPSKE